jgi:TonB family protein
MKPVKFYSTILCIACLFTGVLSAKAQTQENPQQKMPTVIPKSTEALQKSVLYRVEPEYPQEAKAQGISGTVVLAVRVDETGKVISTTPVSGQQLLVNATMKAVKAWKFSPTALSGVAVQVIGNLAFHFTADGKVSNVLSTSMTGSVSQNEPVATVAVEGGSPPFISDKEAKELSQQLQNAYDIPLRLNNPEGVVLEIVKATVRAVKRDQQNYLTNDPVSAYVTDYAMRIMITLHNRADKKITGVGFKFTNTTAQHIFFAYPHIAEIQAQGDYLVQLDLIAVAGNPADLQAEIVGVRFADKTIGGAFPTPQYAVGNAPMSNPASDSSLSNVKVDTKPRPLNRLRPNYTYQARKNTISGIVRLKVEIGTDGSAKRIHVANALPDGLTEEAIRIIKVLQFKPAMAAGKPVDYWIVLDVEFNLI